MSTKFAPGPWLVTGTTVYSLQHYGWRKGVEQFENRFSFFVQGSSRTSYEELTAVANLAAHAPDLLSELKKALEYIDMIPEHVVPSLKPGFDRDWTEAVILAAESSIMLPRT